MSLNGRLMASEDHDPVRRECGGRIGLHQLIKQRVYGFVIVDAAHAVLKVLSHHRCSQKKWVVQTKRLGQTVLHVSRHRDG